MATADTATEVSGNDERSTENEYPFTAVLLDDGIETVDMIHRHISGLVDEYRLHITDDGWSFTVVDPANVGMFDVSIPTTVFEEYNVQDEITVGVMVDEFNDALQDSGKIQVGYRDKGGLEHFVGEKSLHAIDPDSIRMEPDVPELNLPTTAVIEDIELFTHFCENTGNKVQISGSDEGIALHCDKDVSNDTLLLPDGNGSEVRETTNNGDTRSSLHDRVADMHDGNETDVSLFSQDYLKKVFKNLLVKHKRGVSYELELGTEFPLKLHRRDDTDVEFTFMLAPRIQ